MSERDPIDLIREQLNRVEGMAGLHPDHEAFKEWHAETKTILEKVFTSKSIHCQNFLSLRFREVSIKAFSSPEIDKINAARFKKDLEHLKNILQSAIKELTLDRTFFKKLQTTPKTGVTQRRILHFFWNHRTRDGSGHRKAFEGSGLSHYVDPPTKSPFIVKSIRSAARLGFTISRA
jgi:hypothetical protein